MTRVREPPDPDALRHALSVVAEAIVAALVPAPAVPEPASGHDALPEYVTSKEIAARARVNKTTLYRWIEAGKFPRPAISLGSQQPRWRTSDVLQWERERQP